MVKYIFICSAGHSGSTLLDLLIGSHSRIESLGEIAHLPKNVALNTTCMCGTALKECTAWGRVFAEIFARTGIDVLQHPYDLNLGFINPKVVIDRTKQTISYNLQRELSLGSQYVGLRYGINVLPEMVTRAPQIVEHSLLLYDSVRTALDVDAVVDSSKSYIRAIQMYRAAPENVRIIMLSRDGRGVFYSFLKRNFGLKESLGAWKKHYVRSMEMYNKHVNCSHLLTVRYEDLASGKGRQLERICEFLGYDYEDAMVNFLGAEHHITNGNDMRFGSTEIKLDTAWEHELGATELSYFNKHAGKLNKRLGY